MTRGSSPVDARHFDLRGLLRADDWIVCGQAAAEPLTLTRRLMADDGTALPSTVFLGTTLSASFDGPVPQGMRFVSYGAMARTCGSLRRRVQIVTMRCTPASTARAMTSGRSASKSGKSR